MNTKSQVLRLLEAQRGSYISGSELARRLQVSRNSVWKAVHELQKDGYVICGKTNCGYCLGEENDLVSAEGILPYLRSSAKMIRIQGYKSVDSTNNVAKKIALDGMFENQVILAETQTSGRGRNGRQFYSPRGSGLYLSFLLRSELKPEQAILVTSAAALAVTQSIEKFITDEKIQIKWVNDLFLNGKKICGILTEASSNWESGRIDHIILGIGINVSEGPDGFPKELQGIAGAIYKRGEAPLLRNRLAAEVISQVLEMMNALEQNDAMAHSVIEEVRRRSLVLGNAVDIQGFGKLKRGLAIDLDERGFLVVEDAEGKRHTLSSGEISLQVKKHEN